jgi:type I restriction enzyme S subunit
MDAQQFIAEFKHIASAPGGVQRVRELILQLAISGDLTTRVVGDIGAPDLIAANRKEQRRLVSQGVLKRQHALPKISESEQPWSLPEGWLWCRLGDVTSYGYVLKAEPEDVDENTWVLELEDIEKGTSRLLQRVRAQDRRFKSTKNRFVKGSVLYGKLRPYLDKVLIADEDGVCTTEIIPISFFENIEAAYLRWYLKSPFFIEYATNSTHGMNLPRISTEAMRIAMFPLPPSEEQKYIITKVDELMAVCDKLEAQQQEREGLCERSRKAALDFFASAQDSASFSIGWKRVSDGIDVWLDNEVAVTELMNVVSFLGCRGLLTESAPIDTLEADDAASPLPTGWSWTTLKRLADYITSGSRGWRQYMAPRGDIFIRSQDIKSDALVFEDPAFVNLPDRVEGKRTLVRPGDLLITITGANVGKCAQVPKLPGKAYVSQHVALVRVSDVRHTPFLHWWITNTYGGRKHLARYIYGDKPGLNLPQVGSIPIPLPPQEAQDRIVEALGHYTVLCDRLASQIQDARRHADLLATAVVAAMTGIRIEDKEKMKAPKTELVSNIRIGVAPSTREQAPLATILVRHQGELPAKALWSSSGLEIEAFYQQLKTEIANGWIAKPEPAYVKEVEAA